MADANELKAALERLIAGAGMMIFPGPYHIPRMDYVARAVYTNTCGRCAYRGPWMF